MSHEVFCEKLHKTAAGLSRIPYPGDLGLRIQAHISAEAWANWMQHQTLLINEHRLNLMDKKARSFLETEMVAYLFGAGSAKPAGFVKANTP